MSDDPKDKDSFVMNRRRFLHSTLAAGAAASLGAPFFSKLLPHEAHAVPRREARKFEFDEVSIAELSAGMRQGKWTAKRITEKYLDRIEEIDRRGPKLNSVIETNPDALAIAEALDRERKERGERGPLHGIPVLIKDNIDTADRMMTTAGSLALLNVRRARDAVIVERLRRAGAVILGKTNLSEWANFRSTHSTSGWSARGGQTQNPYALDRNPCGSSSGSGAAVSANLCAVAIGTETDGSIVCPSSANGIVGIKPTLGLLSQAGIIPIAHSQDTAGPMTRTVTDAAILLTALAEPNAPAGSGARQDYTKFLDARALRGARVGVVRKFMGYSDRVDQLMKEAVDVMKREGAIIIDPVEFATAGKFDDSEFEVLLYEFKTDLNKYLAGLGPQAPVRTLKDLIEFNERNRAREMPFFGQEIFVRAEAKGPLTSREYRAALAKNHRLSKTEGIDLVMQKHRLDALVAPTGGPPWTTDLINGDHFSGSSSTPAAVAGYPNINVPAGTIHGLPVGISFFGRAWSEGALIKLAYAYEQATRHRVAPTFFERANLG